jgi:hypothetical protein
MEACSGINQASGHRNDSLALALPGDGNAGVPDSVLLLLEDAASTGATVRSN